MYSCWTSGQCLTTEADGILGGTSRDSNPHFFELKGETLCAVRPRQCASSTALALIAASAATSGALLAESKKKRVPRAKVTVTPVTANVRAGAAQQFTAKVTGTLETGVTWSVNGMASGSAATGTINSAGLFVAPQTVPASNSITVTATSDANHADKGSATVTLLNPTPILSNVSPSTVNAGSFTLTITGSNFVKGATVELAGTALSTTFVSATQLTAAGSQSVGGTYAVTVGNPNPGASSSSAINLTVNGSVQSSACSGMSIGAGASLKRFRSVPCE